MVGWRGAAGGAIAALGLVLLLTAETELSYYQRVGVPPDADTAAIKKAYRAKARVLHPDKNLGEKGLFDAWWAGDDTHRFSRLVEAYECLADDECRANYDAEMRGEAAAEQLHWSQRWQARRAAKEAQWRAAWDNMNSPREAVLLALHSAQEAVLSLPDWLPSLLTPRGFVRFTFGLLIFLLSVEIVLKPALSLLWLPVRVLGWLLAELSGQRRRRDQRRKEEMADARERLQAQALAPPEPEPEPPVVRAAQTALGVSAAQKLAIAKAVGAFVGGNAREPAGKGAALLLKIIDKVLEEPAEEKYRRIRTTNKAFASLLAMEHAQALVFAIGFAPTADYKHLVLPHDKLPEAAHARKALCMAVDQASPSG